MTTTDTDSLNRRMAGALDPYSEIIAVHEGYGAEVVTHAHQSSVIAAVLPIVAAEVRKAKTEALRKIAPHLNDSGDESFLLEAATEYETGGSDEHR